MSSSRAVRRCHPLAAVTGLAAAVLLSACSAGPQASGFVTGSSGSSSAATAPTQPTPQPTPQPTEPFAIKEGPLAPGRYLQAGFPPGISFVLPSGWKAYFDDADGAYLNGPKISEIGINKPAQVVDPTTARAVDSPPDLAAYLAASPAFDTVKSSSVTVGGKPAKLVEGTAKGEKGLFAYASGNFHTVLGVRYRFYVFPMDGPDLVFFVDAPATSFESSLPMLQAIVDSIKVGGG